MSFLDGTTHFDETSKNGADLHGHARILRGLTIRNPKQMI